MALCHSSLLAAADPVGDMSSWHAFQRLRQPVVLGYIIAGLMIGPHVPVPPVANREIVQTLSELGVNPKERSCAHLPQKTTEFELMVPRQ